jgi:hypothetical protein
MCSTLSRSGARMLNTQFPCIAKKLSSTNEVRLPVNGPSMMTMKKKTAAADILRFYEWW